MPWTPPASATVIKIAETYLATNAAGLNGALPGSMATSAKAYAILYDTDTMGKSHLVGFITSMLAKQTLPTALVL